MKRTTICTLLLMCIASTARGADVDSSTEPDAQAAAADEARVAITGTVTIDAPGALIKPNVARVVVYLDSHPKLDPPAPEETEEAEAAEGQLHDAQTPLSQRPQIAQRNKAFVPDLLVVTKYTWVEFPNWDQFSHNVFSRSKDAPPFDLDRYPYGTSKSYQFTKLGVVQVFCNIHPQMRATVVVVPNRYFAQTDASGNFAINDVPPGEYELVTWHPQCAEHRQAIHVEPDAVEPVAVTLEQNLNKVLTEQRRRDHGAEGVMRGLSVRKDKLNLPVVEESHPACHPDTPDTQTAGSETSNDEATH